MLSRKFGLRAFSIAALCASAGIANAASVSVVINESVTFNNKNSIDAQGDVDNNTDSAVLVGGYSANFVRVTGSLTEIETGTFANEARVRLTPAGAPAFNLQASAVGNFTGTLAIGPSDLLVTPFDPAGNMGFEWFESIQDGTAGLPEAIWDTVTYEFGTRTIINGNADLGTLVGNGLKISNAGTMVAGGLDFYSVSIPYGVTNIGEYLNIQTLAGGAGAFDTEIAIYDSLGNRVADDDDGSTVANLSMMSFGASDPIAQPGATANTNPAEDGATLAGGNYTIVVGGFNTAFGATIGAITPGTAFGEYRLSVTYVPEPSALVLLALGAIVAGRRR